MSAKHRYRIQTALSVSLQRTSKGIEFTVIGRNTKGADTEFVFELGWRYISCPLLPRIRGLWNNEYAEKLEDMNNRNQLINGNGTIV